MFRIVLLFSAFCLMAKGHAYQKNHVVFRGPPKDYVQANQKRQADPGGNVKEGDSCTVEGSALFSVVRTDDGRTCICMDDTIKCAEPSEKVCRHNGKTYQIGERWGAECQKCKCSSLGTVCVDFQCKCVVRGNTIDEFQVFRRGCHECTCIEGRIICDRKFCSNGNGRGRGGGRGNKWGKLKGKSNSESSESVSEETEEVEDEVEDEIEEEVEDEVSTGIDKDKIFGEAIPDVDVGGNEPDVDPGADADAGDSFVDLRDATKRQTNPIENFDWFFEE